MNKILKVMCFILFALFAGINTIYAQGQSPTGLVVDENGQPMIGVQIKIEGTTVGAITAVEGIIEENVNQSIRNLTKIGSEGMNETDKLVLDIMTHKHCD